MNGLIHQILGMLTAIVLLVTAGCVQADPADDSGNTLSPTAMSLPGPDQPLAYEPEMRQLFASDCVYCHGGYRVDDGFSMKTYEDLFFEMRPGFPESGLIKTTQPGGSMYLYWSGSPRTQQLKADMVYRWIVTYNAQRTR